jgi:hypothetical protein
MSLRPGGVDLARLFASSPGGRRSALDDRRGRRDEGLDGDALLARIPRVAEREGIDARTVSNLAGAQLTLCDQLELRREARDGGRTGAAVIWVNAFLVRDLTAPFGGMGISAIGRGGGQFALGLYSDLKSVQVLEGSLS